MNHNHNVQGPAKSSSTDQKNKSRSSGATEENMWSSMLDSVASGKKLPEKNILVLGGNPESQKEFLDTLASDAPKRFQERNWRKPPIANEFALGYTYQDVLDADHEDILARLSIYLLSESSLSFTPLIKPLFTSHTVPNTLIVILLDWAEPWLWVRQIRDTILFLKEVISSVDDDTKSIMAEVMKDWQQRKRGGPAYDASGGSMGGETNVIIPLSEGEWDEGLGVPLCVVCHSADKIDILEKEQGWREEDFDYVLQFLRTILMKHGASLIYTSISDSNSLPALIHSTLGIHSLLKKQSLKHNIIDRNKVLIPPSWDSWGKIRVLREGFDVEGVSRDWSKDMKQTSSLSPSLETSGADSASQSEKQQVHVSIGQTLAAYEKSIKDPRADHERDLHQKNNSVPIELINNQEFLAGQLEIMDRLKAEEERSIEPKKTTDMTTAEKWDVSKWILPDGTPVQNFVGPVQVNVGGIQVDADAMSKNPGSQVASGSKVKVTPEMLATPQAKAQHEELSLFFEGLMKRGGSNSPRSTTT